MANPTDTTSEKAAKQRLDTDYDVATATVQDAREQGKPAAEPASAKSTDQPCPPKP